MATAFSLGALNAAKAGSAKLNFTATVAKVENGIGMSGDRTVTKTLRDVAAISFIITNPRSKPQHLELTTYDAHFRAISDVSLTSSVTIPAGATKRVFAYVPVASGQKRRLRICAKGDQGTRCGKFIAQHLP
ncbi:MAG: hypothetical protein AAFR27_01830 [Pseudomonadota bacterium]